MPSLPSIPQQEARFRESLKVVPVRNTSARIKYVRVKGEYTVMVAIILPPRRDGL